MIAAGVVIGAAGIGVLAAGAPAIAVTGVEALVEACGDQAVCQYDGAAISNAGELADALPAGVRVVVIPQPDQAESVQSSTLASQFQKATGADTVIIIEDYPASDRFAVASADGAAISEALYSQGQTDGGLAVAAIEQQLASPGHAPAADAGAGFGGIAAIGGAVIALAAIATGTILLLNRRKKARGERTIVSARKLEKELADALDGPDGDVVRDAIENLDGRAQAYPDLQPHLASLSRHISDLFVRVRRRGNDQQTRLLQSQYKDTLTKLHKALADDYYGDILANPQYWSRPAERLDEVRRAVAAVDAQAVENIKQVNESRDLEFQVALDSLNQTVSEAKLSDVYSDRDQ